VRTTGAPRLNPIESSLERSSVLVGEPIEFIGRETELKELWSFLDAAPAERPDFRWWLWTGSAGQGKTRLATELAKQARDRGWDCGFLSPSLHYSDWDGWQVRRPTLVIIDHVAHRAAAVRDAICALSRSSNIAAPLRFLLLERDFNASLSWTADLVPTYDTDLSGFLDAAHCQPPNHIADSIEAAIRILESPDADETRDILCAAAAGNAAARPIEDLFDALAALDSKHRPLFAILTARTAAQDGASSRLEFLRGVLTREFKLWSEHFSLDSRASQTSRLTFDQHLNVIAFASLVGALHPGSFEILREHRVQIPEAIDTRYLGLMTAVEGESAEEVHPLQPDILGELYLLERLGGKLGMQPNASLTRAQTQRLLSIALAHYPRRLIDFAKRCLQDFPEHPALTLLTQIKIPEEDEDDGGQYDIGLYVDHCVHFSAIASSAQEVNRFDIAEGIFSNLIVRGEPSFGETFELRRLVMLASFHHNRAYARYRSGSPEAARQDYTQALACLGEASHLPDFQADDEWQQLRASCLLGRALIDHSQQRWADAEEALNQVIPTREHIPQAIWINALLTRAEV
jgi:tetratricopeptide (TPR) repeat protein